MYRGSPRPTALTPTLFLVSASFFALILLPGSLPLLRLGAFEFAYGVGDVILILAFLPLLGEILLTGKIKFPHGINRLDKAILLYFLILLLPVAVGILRFPEKSVFMIAAYTKNLEVLMIYLLIRKTLTITTQANRLLQIFVVVFIGVLVISTIQLLSPSRYLNLYQTIGFWSRPFSESFQSSVGWRLSGPFFNPNTLAQFLLLAIPISWVIYSLKHRLVTRFFWLCLIMLAIAILVLTQSRSGYLGFLLTLLIFMYHTKFRFMKLNTTHIAIIIVLLGVSFFYGSLLYHRIFETTFSAGEELDASLTARFASWEAGIHATWRYWLTGIGIGQSGAALGEFLPYGSIAGIHNTFLRVLIEGGIIMFTAFVFLLAQIWSWRKVGITEPWNHYKYALIAGFVGLIVTGFLGDTFQSTEIMLSFAFLLGTLNSVYQIGKGEGLSSGGTKPASMAQLSKK